MVDSDSSSDSDSGIRFKTHNVRNSKNVESYNAKRLQVPDTNVNRHRKRDELKKRKIVQETSKSSSDVVQDEGNLKETNESVDTYGPALPPKIQKRQFGPMLPTLFVKEQASNSQNLPESLQNVQSKAEINDDDDDDDVIGPLPPGHELTTRAATDLEIRALEIKLNKNKATIIEPSREEWMTELPEVALPFSLGPRQFRANPAPDLSDRSSWTDTPKIKESKKSGKVQTETKDLGAVVAAQEARRRDEQQESMVKEYNKKHKRSKKLIDMHQEKLSKQKKEAGGSERRPFNRDIDLKINKLDPSQKEAYCKQAMLLDSKFSAGKVKYL